MKNTVFNIIQQMLTNSPEASYKRLNPALRQTLKSCISADLPFLPDTFSDIYTKLRGRYWFGDGAGSHCGEHFYSHAIACNHISAAQSFERFAKRPPVLWEEDVETPFRLHVGATFTWKGNCVEVTSMKADRLIACTYKGERIIARRFTIPYSEIAKFRDTEKQRLNGILTRIANCDPESEAIRKEVKLHPFRRFQLEKINSAFDKPHETHPPH